MSKQTKKMYRFLAWFFSTVIAAGTLVGCSGKGGPTTKYGPPPAYGYKNLQHKIVAENENGISNSYRK